MLKRRKFASNLQPNSAESVPSASQCPALSPQPPPPSKLPKPCGFSAPNAPGVERSSAGPATPWHFVALLGDVGRTALGIWDDLGTSVAPVHRSYRKLSHQLSASSLHHIDLLPGLKSTSTVHAWVHFCEMSGNAWQVEIYGTSLSQNLKAFRCQSIGGQTWIN